MTPAEWKRAVELESETQRTRQQVALLPEWRAEKARLETAEEKVLRTRAEHRAAQADLDAMVRAASDLERLMSEKAGALPDLSFNALMIGTPEAEAAEIEALEEIKALEARVARIRRALPRFESNAKACEARVRGAANAAARASEVFHDFDRSLRERIARRNLEEAA